MGHMRFLLPCPAPGTGSYRYSMNGAPTEVTEDFEVHDDGPTTVWAVRRAPGGVELTVHATTDGEANAEVTVIYRSEAVGEVATNLLVDDGRLEVGRHGPDGTETSTTIDPEPTGEAPGILSPLMRVFQGPAIAHAIRSDGTTTVVLPDITDPDDHDRLLTPLVQSRWAERLGVEAVGADDTMLRHCRYIGGRYDDSAEFWLDDHDRLVRYRFAERPDRIWEVELTEA